VLRRVSDIYILMTHVIAHRGLRSEHPENTIASIAAALQLSGLYGIEFDVELTQDNDLVVLHQETLIPSADMSRLELATRNYTSRDWVREATVDALITIDAGSWMSEAFADSRVPTLREALELSWGQVKAYIELKDATFWGSRDLSRPKQVVEAALPSIQSFKGTVDVISFNPAILKRLRSASLAIDTTLALWTEWRHRIHDAMDCASGCGAATVSLPDIMILDEPDWIRVAHERGLKVHAYPVSPARGESEFLSWTPESQQDKWRELCRLGVDAILSDFARETLATSAV
jgi:glycerophosphoryl diester phosphodiesterase